MVSMEDIWIFVSGNERKHAITRVLTPLLLIAMAFFGLITYLLISPFIVNVIHPEYETVKKYADVKMCADLSVQPVDNGVFQPSLCLSLTPATTLGCVSTGTTYVAPSSASVDETLVCPTLTPQITSGTSNPAVPVFKTAVTYYQMIATIIVTAFVTTTYVIIRLLVIRRARSKEEPSA
ncbi:MAG: hypothetical protein ABIP50_03370 [Candidatus Saccharimonadales bacterium]